MFNPKITVQEETTKNPISLKGKETGICYGSNVSDQEKNYKRGLDCVRRGHNRALEFPQVYLTIENVSARFGREWYTHAIGNTRLQASTRYIDYGKKATDNIEEYFVCPESFDKSATKIYNRTCGEIVKAINTLESLGYPKEDANMLLPLGMTTKIITRTNARSLMTMSRVRMCARAYKEYQVVMDVLREELANYSLEWSELVELTFGPRCFFGKCEEADNCPKGKISVK